MYSYITKHEQMTNTIRNYASLVFGRLDYDPYHVCLTPSIDQIYTPS